MADARAAFLADAGMVFPADPAGIVTVCVASLADDGMVTVGVTDLADARAASLADAGMALQVDFAGVITVGVAPLADAGAASLADPAGNVASGVMVLTVPAPVETVELLQGCVARDCDVDDPGYSDSEMSCDDCVSASIWCQEMPQIRNNSGCQYVCYMSCVPVGMDYDVPADGYNCTFETLLSEPLCAVMDGVAYREKIESLSGYFDPQDCGSGVMAMFPT